MDEIILVRHTEISNVWKNKCYGISDIPLSAQGEANIAPTAAHIAGFNPVRVIHSGLSRAQKLAAAIAGYSCCPMLEDNAFREMNFGSWEGRSWAAIFADVGHNMTRMITEPETFAPPGGETVHGVRNRAVNALLQVSADGGVTIVVTHGGPIGAIRGTLQQRPVKDWPGLVPQYGATIKLTRADLSKLQAFFLS